MQANIPQVSPQGAAGAPARPEPALLPPVDIVEDANGITVTADMPGVEPDDLVIRVEGRNLTLEAPLRLGEADSISLVYSEVRAGRYRRSFELSGELDTGAIQADFKDGVLKLHLPKMERAKPRRIEVRAAG
jgi:HSP20 family molecular chaperone IbpA